MWSKFSLLLELSSTWIPLLDFLKEGCQAFFGEFEISTMGNLRVKFFCEPPNDPLRQNRIRIDSR